MQVSISEAKTRFSQLVKRVASGEEIVITKAGRPIVVLVPYESTHKPLRKPGGWKGKVKIMPGFDAADKEIEKLFYG
jgi:prevent-host-death family protein